MEKYTLTLKRRDVFYQVVTLVLISTCSPWAGWCQQIYILIIHLSQKQH